MIINEAGEYTLQYTATDACGNTTTVERDLVVDAPPRTVRYTDGTFIINELGTDQATNTALHGQPLDVYAPFDPNGDTDVKKYIFTSASERPWNSAKAYIKRIEIGSPIQPEDISHWFQECTDCTEIDLNNLDTSQTTRAVEMCDSCSSLVTMDVSGFDTSNMTDMNNMFWHCSSLTELDVSGFDTRKVTDMHSMFNGCSSLEVIDVSNFNTSLVTSMSKMFIDCGSVKILDLSNFDKTSLSNIGSMFNNCSLLTTIYASSSFDLTTLNNITIFDNCTNLVGGAGTTFNSSNKFSSYGRIDNPPDAPGYFTAKS